MVDTEDGSSAMMNEFNGAEEDDVFLDIEALLGDVGSPDDPPQGFLLDLSSMHHQQELQTSEAAPITRDSLRGTDAPPLGDGYVSGSREFDDDFLDSERNSAQDFEKTGGVPSQIIFPNNDCSGSVSGFLPVPRSNVLYMQTDGGASSNWVNERKKFQMDCPSDVFHSHLAKNSSGLNYLNHRNAKFGHDESGSKRVSNLEHSHAWMEVSPGMDKEVHSGEARHNDSSSCEISGTDFSETLSEHNTIISDDVPSSSESKPFGDGVVGIDNFEIENSRSMMHADHLENEVGQYKLQFGTDSNMFRKTERGHPKYTGMELTQIKNCKNSMLRSESTTFSELPLKNYAADASGLHSVGFGQSRMQSSSSVKREISFPNLSNKVPKYRDCYNSNARGVQINSLELNTVGDDDDSDLCIIEHMSAPPRPNSFAINTELVAPSQYLVSSNSVSQVAVTHSRHRLNDERGIFRAALQDLSHPQLEANPPHGLLSVPLLKHQRIALSWMVNKETTSACCSGGILADDQGLGKTVSTIALILMERSQRSKALKIAEEPLKTETLNLDDDDEDNYDGPHETSNVKEECDIRKYLVNSHKPNPVAAGRPSAGTLIVCPTSVLKQWSDELHNKVTREADLLVLLYHGNRTKDPLELAKYDVVITTYAIVTMEVPQQPVVDENDDEIGSAFNFVGKKRKLAEDSENKFSKRKKKKGVDSESLESKSGPLARVNWFRVVLDEAQSIKNHKTQVARACWGLRAKRRWCLSGTPIQNAIDDLYSYFRFLRHEPYAVFKTFCEQIKVPVHRNPKQGYKKLQAVLKTVMLRRTKATRIDGQPIINLPPKTIEMKQVDFSKEEREFYSRLEADSKAQFAEYAAAGTVKQNYVNILLMLLRLRQACDHPLLIKGFDTSSKMTSSIDIAKKLTRETRISLLNCLQASLAICEICSDPPEDAVVTVCGHVFCNQCICEHISGDDSLCPTKNCKTRLSMSDWFSSTALQISLSDHTGTSDSTKCNGLELAVVSNPYSINCPEGSSKIRAALELLRSLSAPQDCASRSNSSELNEGSQKLPDGDSTDNESKPHANKDSNNSPKNVGQKAIVFSQWTRMLDLLESCLKSSSIQYRRLDGTMHIAARDRAVKDFNTLPQVSVMIMSLKAASLGLNMVAACNVILLDLWWNPTTEDQAIDRAHRIGQTRPVSVYRLTVKDTVEDRILALQLRKRKMVASAFGEDEAGGRQTRLTVDDLKYLFS